MFWYVLMWLILSSSLVFTCCSCFRFFGISFFCRNSAVQDTMKSKPKTCSNRTLWCADACMAYLMVAWPNFWLVPWSYVCIYYCMWNYESTATDFLSQSKSTRKTPILWLFSGFPLSLPPILCRAASKQFPILRGFNFEAAERMAWAILELWQPWWSMIMIM